MHVSIMIGGKKMEFLTEDDLFEIEKIIDIYSGWVNDHLSKTCQIAIHYTAVKKGACPLDDPIHSMKQTYDKLRMISKKLETNRKTTKKE